MRALIFAVIAALACGLKIVVPASRTECMYHEVADTRRLVVSVAVFRGGARDIHVKVFGPKQEILKEQAVFTGSEHAPDDVSVRPMSPGVHSICLDNSASQADKIVQVLVPVKKEDTYAAHVTARALAALLTSIEEKVARVQNHFKGLSRQAEETVNIVHNKRIRKTWASVVVSTLLAACSVGQVLVVRHWLHKPGVQEYLGL